LPLGDTTDAKSALIWDLIVPPRAATAGELDALARKLGLDLPLGQVFLDALGSPKIDHVTLSRESLARLDPARPVAAVGLYRPQATCVALPFEDAAGAARALDEIGPEVRRQGAVSLRRAADGTVMAAGLHDRTLFLGHEPGSLSTAAAVAFELAEASVRAHHRGVTVEVYPGVLGAFGRAAAEAALPAALSQMESTGKGGDKMPHEVVALLGGLAHLGIRASASVQVLRLSLDVGVDAGVAIRLEADPVPSTDFARRLARPTPYAVDEGLALTDDRSGVSAWGTIGTSIDDLGEVLAQGGPTARALRRALLDLGALLEGGGSCQVDFSSVPVRSLCAWRLRPAASPRKVLARYGSLIETYAGWFAALTGQRPGPVKIRRARDVLEIDAPADVLPDENEMARAFRRAMWGGDSVPSAVAVRGRSLVVAHGGPPGQVLAGFGRRPASARGPRITEELERTRGADAMLYADPFVIFAALTKPSDNPLLRQVGVMFSAIPGLTDVRAPIVFTARSGERLSFELAVPTTSLANLAAVVKPFMGEMGARH
jgi:hypothetical protein